MFVKLVLDKLNLLNFIKIHFLDLVKSEVFYLPQFKMVDKLLIFPLRLLTIILLLVIGKFLFSSFIVYSLYLLDL